MTVHCLGSNQRANHQNELALNAGNLSECAKRDWGFNTSESEYHGNSAKMVE